MNEFDIVIVGAGAAGIAAARALANSGLSLLLLEADSRLGGRAHTTTVEAMALDLGCGWLHSAERNPWRDIALAGGFTIDRRRAAWFEQYRDLGFSKAEQREAQAAQIDWQARLERDPPQSDRAADALPAGGIWNDLIDAISGYLNGTATGDLSVADYLAYERAAGAQNWRVVEGYGTLIVASLPRPVPLRLATPVTAIDRRGRKLRIETTGGTIDAKAAILTVSTAMLASGAIRFDPPLDDRLHAAACLPLGHNNKLFLAVDDAAGLETETRVLGNPHRIDTGSYYIRPFGRPAIEAYFGGAHAKALEAAGPDASFAFAVDELAALFGSDIRQFLSPLAASAWGQSRWVGGSYSHALPGHSSRRLDLARPVEDRLFFAGEATSPRDFSTAHGAYASGLRAAAEAMRLFRGADGAPAPAPN